MSSTEQQQAKNFYAHFGSALKLLTDAAIAVNSTDIDRVLENLVQANNTSSSHHFGQLAQNVSCVKEAGLVERNEVLSMLLNDPSLNAQLAVIEQQHLTSGYVTTGHRLCGQEEETTLPKLRRMLAEPWRTHDSDTPKKLLHFEAGVMFPHLALNCIQSMDWMGTVFCRTVRSEANVNNFT